MKYTYPDRHDKITVEYINTAQYIPNYWEISEAFVLSEIIDKIVQVWGTTGKLLDVGCGEGRLFEVFKDFSSNIDAIEPDYDRYLVAKGKNDHVENVGIIDYDSAEKYHIVLSSHIIQHVATDTLDEHLNKLSSFLLPNGLLVVNTCHSVIGKDYFVKSEIINDMNVETQIEIDEFNLLTSAKGILPIHFFWVQDLIKRISAIGFDLLDVVVYHADTDVQRQFGGECDVYINSSWDLKEKYGRDMSLIFIKKTV